MKYNTLLIDGPYLSHRSHCAPYNLTTSTGLNATAIHNFMRSLLSFYKKFKPETVAVCWESHGTPSWRRQLYADYKPAGTIDPDYLEELADIKILLHLLNIKQFYAPANEADDVLCTLVTKHTEHKSVVIFTRDKDIMQLVTSNIPPVHIYDGKEIFDEMKVFKKFGVFPYQICDYLSLVGDTVDNIPGVNGIGPKKATKLLEEHDTVEAIPIEDFPNGNDSFFQAIQAKQLIALNCEAQVKCVFTSDYATDLTLEKILDKYELESIKKDLSKYQAIGEKQWI